MNIRNMVILFLSVLAISLVILVIIFSLFFKNIDFSFSTHAPVTAPNLSEQLNGAPNRSRAEDVNQSNVRVPGGEEPNAGPSGAPGGGQGGSRRQAPLPGDDVYYQEDNSASNSDPYAIHDRDPNQSTSPPPIPAGREAPSGNGTRSNGGGTGGNAAPPTPEAPPVPVPATPGAEEDPYSQQG